MKIFHVITGLTVGGAETMLYKLSVEFRRQGHDSVVVCVGPRGGAAEMFHQAGLRVVYLGLSKNPLSIFRIARLVRLLRAERPEAVQSWMYHGNIIASLAAFLSGTGAPVYWNIRQALYSIRREKSTTLAVILIGALFSRSPRRVVYNSYLSAAQHERIGYAPQKTKWIPNGFETALYKPLDVDEREKAREVFGLPAQAFVVGIVARYDLLKDHRTFVKAAALVAQRHPQAHFVAIGRGLEASTNPVKDWAAEAGLAERFQTFGERNDIHAWMGMLDVLASSSIAEAFPNVVGEAMACGVPCVVTDVGDCARVVGEFGYVVPPRSPGAIAEALCRLIEASPEARGLRGEAGRARIMQNFSIDAVAGRYLDLYREPDGSEISCVE